MAGANGPSYDWVCLYCETVCSRGTGSCAKSGFPASASGAELERAKQLGSASAFVAEKAVVRKQWRRIPLPRKIFIVLAISLLALGLALLRLSWGWHSMGLGALLVALALALSAGLRRDRVSNEVHARERRSIGDSGQPLSCTVGRTRVLVQAVSWAIFAALTAGNVAAQLAPNAPPDKALTFQEQQLAAFEKAIAPYVKVARETYPGVRARFLQGLPQGQHFFVVARASDESGRWEQIFVRVETIRDGIIAGVVSSQVSLPGLKLGQSFSVKEGELLDWVITKPDGSEEGNVVGKFLDTYDSHGA